MGNAALTKFSKLTIWSSRYDVLALRSTEHLFRGITGQKKKKMHNQSNHETTTDKFKLGDNLQNNYPVLFKNVKVKKYKSSWESVPY